PLDRRRPRAARHRRRAGAGHPVPRRRDARRPARERAARSRPHRAAGHDRRLPPHPVGDGHGQGGMSWRRIRALLVREVRATFRDRFTVTILIAVPIAALLLFGFILTTEVKHLDLAILDASNTSGSRRI